MLPDYLRPRLEIVFCGLNPGTYSDRVGHYFARKQNLFWSALYESGLVPVPLRPEDDARMLDYNYGLTDIVRRATPNVSTVARDEFAEGGRVLQARLTDLSPRLVCFVGLVGYRHAYDPRAVLGLQAARWGDAHLFIVPSTSPRNAYYRDEIIPWFRRLREYHHLLTTKAQGNDGIED